MQEVSQVGLCASEDVNPDWWFADALDVRDRASALSLCRACPIRLACLDHALEQPEHFGIWGGYTAETRVKMRAKRLAERKSQREESTCHTTSPSPAPAVPSLAYR